MNPWELIAWLLIGLVAGWLAGVLVKGHGFGVLGDIVVGIIGAVLGGFLFGMLGVTPLGLLGSILTATFGAVVLLVLAKSLRKA